MDTAPTVPWFLDSELHSGLSSNGATSITFIHQPWRKYWPPKNGSGLDVWLRSEFPEVLSWRFDPQRPFDRPWRFWTRSARAKKEQILTTIAKGAENLLESNDSRPSPHQNRYTTTILPSITNDSPETQLKQMKLTGVTPESFYYLAPLELYHYEKPYLSRLPCLDGLKRTNIKAQSHSVTIFDVSGHEDLFTLKDSGFEFSKVPMQIKEWTDSSVCSSYIPKLSEWLKQHLGCLKVFIYAYNFRGERPQNSGTRPWKAPFFRVHCDATAEACMKRLRLYLPDEAENAMKGRVRFLNVWRPLSTPVQDCPLAVCDFRTVRKDDFVKADMIFPHYHDEAYEVIYNPEHRWFYKKGMLSEDVIIFKLNDSSETESLFCPHSAFMDPSIPSGAPKRASIEVRAIIIG